MGHCLLSFGKEGSGEEEGKHLIRLPPLSFILTVLLLSSSPFFSGARYNIPVAFWIPESYPYSSPLVYVQPTRSMIIKVRGGVSLNEFRWKSHSSPWARESQHISNVSILT